MKKKRVNLKSKKINSLCAYCGGGNGIADGERGCFIGKILFRIKFAKLEKKAVFLLFALFLGFCNKSFFCAETPLSKEKKSEENVLKSEKIEITTISIKNARRTSYKKSEETDGDLIILEGAVELEVQKGETTSEIRADNITYDRKTEMLYAEGGVQIATKSSSSGGEKTFASSLLLNASTLEGIFDGGKVVQTQSDALNMPSGSVLIVFSDLFGKGGEKTIAFKNSSLTFCDDENPHWKINATRTWLLPGGEFAFFNALLYIGSVPALYLPIFYYPKDELVFNPVFSTRKREGYAIQTTTYVWGRKPLDASSPQSSATGEESTSAEALKGIYNFVRPTTLKEQKLEGLVLRNLDKDFTGDSSQYVKILADWYTNLGGMFGFDANFNPKNKWISKIALNLDAGFSRAIFKSNNSYFPFDAAGKQYWDESEFMGWKVPFRYGGKLEFSLAKPFSLSVSLPVYSDPYYAYDFKTHRSEYMDWISYFLDSSKTDSEDVVASEVSSFTWQISGSFSPKIPDLLKPYISNLSMSVKSSVSFSSKNTVFSETVGGKKKYYYDIEKYSDSWTLYSPERRFYYPSLATPANFNVSMSGTIFSWPFPEKRKTFNKLSFPITLNKPDELKSQKEKEEKRKAEEEQSEKDKKIENKPEKAQTKEKEQTLEDFKFFLPDLAYNPTAPKIVDGINYKLSYSANANYSSQAAYSSLHLKQPGDFKWEETRSFMYIVKTPLSLKSDFNYGGNFVTVSNGVSYSPVWQEHPFISDDKTIGGYSENEIKNMRRADNNAKSQDIINTNAISLKPFVYFDAFSDSSVTWNSNVKLFRREFSAQNDEEKWENFTADWNDEKSVTVNSISAVLSAKEFDKKIGQTLSFGATMRPLLKQYGATLGLTFPYVTASLSSGIQEKTKDDDVPEKEKWKKNPVSQSLTVTFPLFSKNVTFSQSYSYNQDESRHDSFKLSASWNGISVSYLRSYVTGYDFDRTRGWIPRAEKEFLPYSLTFGYVPPSKTFYRWFNRISVAPNFNTSLSYDFLRPTNSYFIFSPSITFKFYKFLDLTFSSTSRNSVLYWYFHNAPGDFYNEGGAFPFNMFVDLFNSFRFDKNSLRENSGFKLKSLNMSLSHDLHDWKLGMSLKIEPRVITENGRKFYDFSPYFTIGVVWNPMDSIKTTVTDKYGEWKLE